MKKPALRLWSVGVGQFCTNWPGQKEKQWGLGALPDLKCVGSKLFKRNVKKSQGFLSRKKHAAINVELKMDNACKGSRPC